ncbi:MAG: alpha/beta fold hydrolase [Polaromonas sp.]|nr:alpha/beta fold hydrolase [Polaromonas sp.]
MLARLQQFLTLALLAAATAWFAFFVGDSPAVAIAGVLVIMFAYSGLFALELLLAGIVNWHDPAPRPTVRQLAQAWWGESVTSPQVFFWRQPFRAAAIPDQLSPIADLTGRRGVVFVHGFLCNRGFWNPWLRRLQRHRHAFVAVNLEPVFASIDDYAPQIEAAIRQVTVVTGLPPLVVCHSMGGLAVRSWLKQGRSEAKVHHIVTIGTPHRGTWLARFGFGKNGPQMRLLSEWHGQLDIDMPAHRHTLFTCWYSSADNIVFPTSTATLPDADNRLVRGAGHVQMAFLPVIMKTTLAHLDGGF